MGSRKSVKRGASPVDRRGEVRDLSRLDPGAFRPSSEVLPPEFFAAVARARRGRGPQKTPIKRAITIRLSPEVLAHFKAGGPGWQTRIDAALRKIARVR